MKNKAKVLMGIAVAISISLNAFAKAPTPEKVKEYMKLSGVIEVLDVQAKQSAENLKKLDIKKNLKTLIRQQEETYHNFAAETISMVYTDVELDKAIAFLKTEDAKSFIKKETQVKLKSIDRLNAMYKAQATHGATKK